MFLLPSPFSPTLRRYISVYFIFRQVRPIFVWPWNENSRTKQKQHTNGNRVIWLVYRTDTNPHGFWLVKRKLGWKNFIPENFLEMNRYFATATRLVNRTMPSPLKSKCSFHSSESLISKTGFKESYKISVNEDLHVDFVLQHFTYTLCSEAYSWTKAMKKLNRDFNEEEDSSLFLKNLSQYLVNKTRKSTGRDWRDILPKSKRSIPLTNMITNMPAPLDKLLCHLQCFFSKGQWKTEMDRLRPSSSFQKDSSVTLESENLQSS